MAADPATWPVDLDRAELTETDADGFILHETVNPVLLDDALLLIRDMVRGNGLDPDVVAFTGFQGAVVPFAAHMVFRVVPEISRKVVPGKQPGTIVGSEQAAREKIQAATLAVATDLSVRRLALARLGKHETLGFGAKNFTILLDEEAASFVVQDICTFCAGQTKTACLTCHGKGTMPCARCHGRAVLRCPSCRGARSIVRHGKRQACQACGSRGQIRCPSCAASGARPCKNCHGTGRSACAACNAAGWRSTVHSLRVRLKGQFICDDHMHDGVLLSPALLQAVDHFGDALYSEHHADIILDETPARQDQLAAAAMAGEIAVAYDVRLPWGTIGFRLGANEVSGMLFGFRPVLRDMPPFLSTIAAPGLAALKQAASGQHVAASLRAATEFRLVTDALRAVARFGARQASRELEARYPAGLDHAALVELAGHAGAVLGRLGRVGRYCGLALGLAAAMALDSAIFKFLPLPFASGAMAAGIIRPALLTLVGALLTTAIMRLAETAALHRALPHLALNRARRLTPKPGADFAVALVGAFMCAIGAGLLTGHGLPGLPHF